MIQVGLSAPLDVLVESSIVEISVEVSPIVVSLLYRQSCIAQESSALYGSLNTASLLVEEKPRRE